MKLAAPVGFAPTPRGLEPPVLLLHYGAISWKQFWFKLELPAILFASFAVAVADRFDIYVTGPSPFKRVPDTVKALAFNLGFNEYLAREPIVDYVLVIVEISRIYSKSHVLYYTDFSRLFFRFFSSLKTSSRRCLKVACRSISDGACLSSA